MRSLRVPRTAAFLCIGLLAAAMAPAATPFVDSMPRVSGVPEGASLPRSPESSGRDTRVGDALPTATRVLVRKSERRLYLMRGPEVLRSYRVALGLNPLGHKEREGDFRTPEGRYRLVSRNPRSDFFLSMQVSYPSPGDMARARGNGWRPGGSIMLHGFPNEPRKGVDYYATQDWTNGCIALSNSDMLEIWLLVSDNTPIDIEP
jgi:hypothetical protein